MTGRTLIKKNKKYVKENTVAQTLQKSTAPDCNLPESKKSDGIYTSIFSSTFTNFLLAIGYPYLLQVQTMPCRTHLFF
jgi:hypothetical protein